MPRDIRRLLGGHSAASFLARHWHKSPLLVRGAIPGFGGVLSRDELFALAARDDVASRLVRASRGRYSLAHGPFSRRQLDALPARGWTLLVQSVNLHDDRADALMRRFAFVPYARLDDVMISYAAPGGGVGPHVDSYDVFLLQAAGTRRWRYGRQRDLSLVPNAPLKLLRSFTPQHDDALEPGDMLYLPPDAAHDGAAIDACITYSIGFRAPRFQQIVEAFADHLRDGVDVPGRYADPALHASRAPARIDSGLQRTLVAALDELRWNRAGAARFIGRYLTEPKPDVVFEPPRRASRTRFEQRGARDGVRLDRRTQLLYDDERYYLNGDDAPLPEHDRAALTALADRRALDATQFAALSEATRDLLYDWHRHGYLATA